MLHANKSMEISRLIKPMYKATLCCAALLMTACSTAVMEDAVVVEPSVVVESPSAAAKTAAEGFAMPSSPDADIMVVAPVIAKTSRSAPSPRRGVITAGDIDDGLNIGSFQRYLATTRRATKLPVSNFTRPVLIRLHGSNGKPAPGVRVTLRKPGASTPFYSGYSGVDGNITVFPAVLDAGRLREVEMRAFPEGQGQAFVQRVSSTGSRKQVTLPFAGGWKPEFLDLAFVVDTTGSMADELNWLTREMSGIVRAARRSAPGVSIRYGLIVYRDHGDEYVVRNYGFTSNQSEMTGWLRKQDANGGGDYPEAAAAALAAGVGLDWRRGKGERLMFHIADAPPHDRDARAYLEAARSAAKKGVQIFGLGASGVAAESEYLMRQAAAQTNGRYLFLTDDSGVGNGHAEPTISCYQVSKLRDLMVRVLRSELSGRRVEAASGSVIRSVGSYQSGVCRN